MNDWSMSSYFSRVCFLGLTIGLVVVSAQDPVNPPKTSDWNRIRALSPGVITHLKIHRDEAPKGQRRVKGFFTSSTDTSITVVLRTGQSKTIEKRAVSTVRVRRPFKKRYTGWAIGIATAVITGYLYNGPEAWDITPIFRFIFPALITAPATVAGFFMMPTKLVYRAPRIP